MSWVVLAHKIINEHGLSDRIHILLETLLEYLHLFLKAAHHFIQYFIVSLEDVDVFLVYSIVPSFSVVSCHFI